MGRGCRDASVNSIYDTHSSLKMNQNKKNGVICFLTKYLIFLASYSQVEDVPSVENAL